MISENNLLPLNDTEHFLKNFLKKFPLLLNRWVAISFQHIMLLSYIGSRTMYMAETIII